MVTAGLTRNQWFVLICVVLAVGTLILYWPIRQDGFTNFDDDFYITENPHVNAGLTWAGLIWAFKTNLGALWFPLTWISHMVDCQLYGLNPSGHHLTNVLFHVANTLLLFLLLNNLTGALWRSAFVAALFAWHPLHVESVAWAAERKDVLSAFFWMLTLLAYTRYAQRRSSALDARRSTLDYFLALFFFAGGLMSKPMVVTLPFVLLLIDFWPLNRFRWTNSLAEKFPSISELAVSVKSIAGLILEKLPFFALAAAGSVVTYLAQERGGAMAGDSLSFRLANALWAYVRYVSKTFWPVDLAVIYPFQERGLAGLAIVAALLLTVWSGLFVLLARRRPWLFLGWFWFLGTLVPVIGLVQVGAQSMADRFSYLPSIGLFILVVWGLSDFFGAPPRRQKTLALAGIAALAGCLAVTSLQLKYWRNSLTLFRHAIEVTTDNHVACACLGQALDAIGLEDQALKFCRESVRIEPNYPLGQFFLGMVLWKKGEPTEAIGHLNAAAQSMPRNPVIQYNLGKFLLEHGQPDKAVAYFAAALNDNPDFSEAHNALGKTFLAQGKLQPAAGQLSQAATLDPGNPQFHYDYGTVLLANSNLDEAVAQFSEAARLKPDFADAQGNLAVAFARQGKTLEAIAHFSKAVELQPDNPEVHFNLGLAFLNHDQPAEAAAQFSEDLRLTPNEMKAHYRLAQALQRQNKLAGAVLHYREALRLAPDLPEAKNELDKIFAAHPELRHSAALDMAK
ncbi:MAG: tetratricopeptide repeat protein [Verrucomicrobiota bacterium]|jgi:tetratricopeptide (TPR) repeat protein